MFPPAVLVCLRFFISGLIILGAARLLGAALPKGRELWLTALYGVVVLGGGTGSLVFAEQWVPSGLAALFLTTSPFWMVGLEALLPGGARLHAPSLAGILIGFAGAVLLITPSTSGAAISPNLLRGFLVLQFGCVCWCLGSLLQKRQPTNAHPVISGGVQQLATGIAFVPVALQFPHAPIEPSSRSLWAVAYLIVFGSIVGYSSFVYSMEHLPVTIVSTYTYVNPIVAVFLGSLFYGEAFGLREGMAMIAVFSGVAAVKYWSKQEPQHAEAAEAS